MPDDENALKEYEALRNEILALFARQNTRLSLVWAGIGVIIGASVYSKLSELSFIAFFLALLGWWDHLSIDASVRKIGSYIHVCLEPRLPGLNWERITRTVDGTYARPEWSNWRKLSDSLLSPYGLTALICLLTVVILLFDDSTINHLQALARAALSVLSLVFLVAAVRRDFDRHSQAFKWRDAYKSFLDQESGQ